MQSDLQMKLVIHGSVPRGTVRELTFDLDSGDLEAERPNVLGDFGGPSDLAREQAVPEVGHHWLRRVLALGQHDVKHFEPEWFDGCPQRLQVRRCIDGEVDLEDLGEPATDGLVLDNASSYRVEPERPDRADVDRCSSKVRTIEVASSQRRMPQVGATEVGTSQGCA